MANTMTFTLAGQDKLSPKFKSAGRAASTFRQTLVAVGTALAGAAIIRGVFNFGKASVQAFTEAEDAQKRLQFAFDKFPRLANVNIEALRSLNTELAKKTKFDDDNIASGQAVLAQFRLTGKQVQATTPLLLDYAAATGKDVPTAAKDVGRALLGNTKALKAIGINYKSTGNATTDFANITALMRAKVGGFATREGATAGGRLAILKNQFGELQEAVGAKLLPVLSGLTTTGLGVIAWLDASSNKLSPLGAKIGGVATEARDRLVPALKTAGAYVTGTLLPTIVDLAQRGLGQARAGFDKVKSAVQANGPQFRALGAAALNLGQWVVEKVSPAIMFLGRNALPAVASAVSGVIRGIGWLTATVQAHTTTAKVLAGVLVGVFVPGWIASGIAATISGARQVGAWVATSTAGVRGAIAHSISVVKIVGGWVLMGLSAIRSGATTVAIWALYASSSVRAAASHVVAAARVAGGWVLMAGSATASAARVAAGWALTGLSALRGAATSGLAAARVAGAWALMKVQALANAARMAAAWFIAMGPVGWVIGGLVLVGAAFVVLWKKSQTFRTIVSGALNGVKTAAQVSLNWIRTNWKLLLGILISPISLARVAIGKLFDAKTGLRKIFSDAVTRVGQIWDGLKEKTKSPIRFMVNTVLNQGLIDSFNWVSGKFGGPTIKHVSLPKGFAAGGKIPGRPSSVDNLVARGPRGQRIGLATGEFIVNARSTARHLPLLEAINGFANGGLFGTLKNAVSKMLSGGKELGKDVLGFLGDPGGWFKKRLSGPLGKLADLGSSELARLVRALPPKLVDQAISKAKSFLGGMGSGPINPGLAGALGWARSQAGKPYVWGGVGPNGYDCSGFMSAIVNVIKGQNPYRRLFATGNMPAGVFQRGPGAFSVAWFRGNPGHTAGTLNGVNVESRGGEGVVVGPRARGAANGLFNSGRWHLPGYAAGGRVEGRDGDAPFDLLRDRRLRRAVGFGARNGGVLLPGHFAYNETRAAEAVFNQNQMRNMSIDYDKMADVLLKAIKSGKDVNVTQTFPQSGDPMAAFDAGTQRLVSLLGDM